MLHKGNQCTSFFLLVCCCFICDALSFGMNQQKEVNRFILPQIMMMKMMRMMFMCCISDDAAHEN